MNQEMIDNIKNYSEEIETIEDYMAAIRQTIGQYLGYKGNKGYLNMFREIFQNSIDELMKNSSPCDSIYVFYNATNNEATVIDNGRGIPFDDIVRVFTNPHTSSNYKKNKKPGEFSSGMHGIGSKATNAASRYFIVNSNILGKHKRVEFRDGLVYSEGEIDNSPAEFQQGTEITFAPHEVMGEVTVDVPDILNLITLLLPLLKIGAKITFKGVCRDGTVIKEEFINTDGINTFLFNMSSNPLIEPIHIFRLSNDQTMKAEIAFVYDVAENSKEEIVSFSNYCPTSAGTHIGGFIEGLTKFFRDYMNKIYLAKNNKTNVVSNDIRNGLKAVVSVAHLQPIFTGQAKEILSNDDMFGFCKQLVIDSLNEWIKSNPSDLQRLCKYFKEMADIRMKLDGEKIKLSNKYKSSSITKLPDKFIDATAKNDLELIITEGDSAKGSYRNSRAKNQALFPIKGKMGNPFTKSKAKYLNNAEVSAIMTIVGYEYGKYFDISKCKWSKIIIANDADPDGQHIRTLVMKLFLMYMPEIIEDGRLFGAIPPLFGLKGRGGKIVKYFTNELDVIRYSQEEFSKEHQIGFKKGEVASIEEIVKVLYNNRNLVSELEKISNIHAIDPYLLESILIAYHKYPNDLNGFSKYLHNQYEFLKSIDIMNGSIVIKGTVNMREQLVFFNDILKERCSKILLYLNNSPSVIYMNNKKVSLYTLMKAFSEYVPRLQRYKGLGEMNPEELAESTLYPSPSRRLMQYTVNDIKREIEEMRFYEDNRIKLIEGLDESEE